MMVRPFIFSLWALSFLAGSSCVLAVTVEELYRAGNYSEAAQQGLTEMLREPWNHRLRFMVADSLERSGDAAGAMAQFGALTGTELSKEAAIRFNHLRSGAASAVALKQGFLSWEEAPDMGQFQFSIQSISSRRSKFLAAPSSSPPELDLPESQPELKLVKQLNLEGRYRELVDEAQHLLAKGIGGDELRLMVANGLAWTGDVSAAMASYENLVKSSDSISIANDARVGLANVLRWQGRDDLAMPYYEKVLSEQENHSGALEGEMYAKRELRPKTKLTYGRSSDSGDMRWSGVQLAQSWRGDKKSRIHTMEISSNRDQIPTLSDNQVDVTYRYEVLDHSLKPKIYLSAQGIPERKFFGGAKLQAGSMPIFLTFERMNWGLNAVNANALHKGLAANHFGINGSWLGSFGQVSIGGDQFDISDGNQIRTGNLRYQFPVKLAGIQPFVGAESRGVRSPSSDYWAPAAGYGAYFAGLQGNWSARTWDAYASGQLGWPIYGDAGNAWSASGGGRYWLTEQLALGFSLWKMASQRDQARYRAKSASLNVEALW